MALTPRATYAILKRRAAAVGLDPRLYSAHRLRSGYLTEAARAGGLNPLSSCEEGFCASCAAKRIKGRVVLTKNDIYTDDDLANDWILTCQGHCFGAEVEITYDVV